MAWELCGFGLNCCSHAKRRLSSRNLKTASDVLCDKSYVTIVHSQRRDCDSSKPFAPHRISHIFWGTLILLQNVLLITTWQKTRWTKTNSLHISVLETLTGTPCRQRFFYRNGVPAYFHLWILVLQPNSLSYNLPSNLSVFLSDSILLIVSPTRCSLVSLQTKPLNELIRHFCCRLAWIG